MSSFPLSCQTITFGPDQKDHFNTIIPWVANCGYRGVEIGFRHLTAIPPQQLATLLDTNGLELTGLHIGGNLLDADQAAGEQRAIDQVTEYADSIGVDVIIYSGLHYECPDQFDRDLEALIESAELCSRRGMKLLYHNHNWEFANDWRIMEVLLSERCSGIRLCPDLGWVYRGGADVIDFLEQAAHRIDMVHLKEFSSNDETAEFTEFGRGTVPMADAASWLMKNTDGMWVVLEQDTTRLEPEEAVRTNMNYTQKLFAEVS